LIDNVSTQNNFNRGLNNDLNLTSIIFLAFNKLRFLGNGVQIESHEALKIEHRAKAAGVVALYPQP